MNHNSNHPMERLREVLNEIQGWRPTSEVRLIVSNAINWWDREGKHIVKGVVLEGHPEGGDERPTVEEFDAKFLHAPRGIRKWLLDNSALRTDPPEPTPMERLRAAVREALDKGPTTLIGHYWDLVEAARAVLEEAGDE